MLSAKIISLEKTEVYSNLQAITLPAYFGQTQILSGHAESFFILQPGNIVLRQKNGKEKAINIQQSFAHIQGDNLIVLY